jgi:hypothetical protein
MQVSASSAGVALQMRAVAREVVEPEFGGAAARAPAHLAADFAVARPPLAQPRQRPPQERHAGVVAAAHGVAA